MGGRGSCGRRRSSCSWRLEFVTTIQMPPRFGKKHTPEFTIETNPAVLLPEITLSWNDHPQPPTRGRRRTVETIVLPRLRRAEDAT
jgi:hypothetical protein